jgi:multidrug efflux system membrane fusion protein
MEDATRRRDEVCCLMPRPSFSRLSALTCLGLLSVLTACKGTQGSTPSPAARPKLTVKVAPVVSQDVVYEIKAPGTLEAEELVQITAQVEGAVTGVQFHEGDVVDKGTVLLRIDPDRYQLELRRAEADFQRALADSKRAASDQARREELAKENLVAAEELNRARQESDRLEAEAQSAKAARDLAAQNVARANVRPPKAGVINTKTVETGKFVKMGDVMATLVDVSRLRLRFKVSEGESLRARAAQTVRFRVASLGTREFLATLYHVGDMADPATRQVEVMGWVRNPGELKPGFFAEVALASETRRGALLVPESAVQASEKGFVTYAVEDGKARLRPIQIGLRTGTGLVEIQSGVKTGELVVVEGSDRLTDGLAVQTARSGPAPGAGQAPAGARAAGDPR